MAKGWPVGLSKTEYRAYKELCAAKGLTPLGGCDYRDKRLAGEIEAPEGYVAPVAKQPGPKASSQEGDSTEAEDNTESSVILLDTDGFWGFTMSGHNLSVYKRGTNVDGDLSEWRDQKAHFRKFEIMFNFVKNQMLKEEIKKNGRMDIFLEALKRSEERIMKTVDPKYIAA